MRRPYKGPALPSRPIRLASRIQRVRVGEWDGWFLPTGGRQEWAQSSRLTLTVGDWQREWPRLIDAVRADSFDVLKRDDSGDVMAAAISPGGVPIDVVLKRPRNKYLYRYAFDLFRWSRAWRTWANTLKLVERNVAVERPLAVFERRTGLYAWEAIGVYERVPGVTLEHADLDALPADDRERLFRRCGRTLRRIENRGLAHPDAKSSNWIVYASPGRGPVPVIIDAYGVTRLTQGTQAAGVQRLLRAMKQHAQYTPADSKAICLGFAPDAELTPEGGDAD